jgi:hypothetical protein
VEYFPPFCEFNSLSPLSPGLEFTMPPGRARRDPAFGTVPAPGRRKPPPGGNPPHDLRQGKTPV